MNRRGTAVGRIKRLAVRRAGNKQTDEQKQREQALYESDLHLPAPSRIAASETAASPRVIAAESAKLPVICAERTSETI